VSHFIVLVIGANSEEQLIPFNEDLHEVFKDTTDELLEIYNESSASAIQKTDGTWEYANEKERGVETRFNVMYSTFEAFCKEWKVEKPYENGRYGYFHNPNAKYDWYQVGGRWSGYFKAKPGTQGHLGEISWGCNPPEAGRFDIMRKGDIDFDAMTSEAQVEANKEYDLYEAAVAGLKIPKNWQEFHENFDDIDDARTAYAALPYNKALRDAKLNPWAGDNVKIYGVGRDTYVKRAGYNTFVPYAVLKDGEWVAKGEMGWFGMSNEIVDQDVWYERIAEMLLALPDDTIITAVDCHI
jgi:hypothetical protein